jgi:hypothetical protein
MTGKDHHGICTDTLCRCMNLLARYCTGYLGDIGVPPEDTPMDFSAWFEVYLGKRWDTFDARHNKSRIGRILMARGGCHRRRDRDLIRPPHARGLQRDDRRGHIGRSREYMTVFYELVAECVGHSGKLYLSYRDSIFRVH